ncbi:MAG: peptidoglycan DD-metalloendopeptidase family protein [Propionibacteriaceae bacterium]|nr:peptidoglycan DD-metalloendopeptidase family protein [Propionibacteriaceae bacterium]
MRKLMSAISCWLVLFNLALCDAPRAAAQTGLVLLPPVPGELVTPFDGGTSPYSKGHRGVDLAADAGEPIRAAARGVVFFSGKVAGRPSVSVDHGNGLRTTYTPVVGSLAVGSVVTAGQVIGHLDGLPHCAPEFCLHWGLTDGTVYHDPMLHLATPRVRLLPNGSRPRPVPKLPAATTPLTRGSPPVPGPVTSPFGMRVHPVTGVYKLHDGVDFAASCGTPITLPWAGRVVSARYDGGYGHRVIVEHGALRTAYAHMPRIDVQIGQELAAGAVVGVVGSTGYSTGCHLHWMAWREGRLVDPLTLLGGP